MTVAWLTIALWCWNSKGIDVTRQFESMQACEAQLAAWRAVDADTGCWCDAEVET
jgi:hypothetical protein